MIKIYFIAWISYTVWRFKKERTKEKYSIILRIYLRSRARDPHLSFRFPQHLYRNLEYNDQNIGIYDGDKIVMNLVKTDFGFWFSGMLIQLSIWGFELKVFFHFFPQILGKFGWLFKADLCPTYFSVSLNQNPHKIQIGLAKYITRTKYIKVKYLTCQSKSLIWKKTNF